MEGFFKKKKPSSLGRLQLSDYFCQFADTGLPGGGWRYILWLAVQVSILSGPWCEESEEETETAECGSVCLENRKVLFLMQMVVHVSGYWAPQEPLEWNINGPKVWPHFKGEGWCYSTSFLLSAKPQKRPKTNNGYFLPLYIFRLPRFRREQRRLQDVWGTEGEKMKRAPASCWRDVWWSLYQTNTLSDIQITRFIGQDVSTALQYGW